MGIFSTEKCKSTFGLEHIKESETSIACIVVEKQNIDEYYHKR